MTVQSRKKQGERAELALEKGKAGVYNHPSPKQVVRLEGLYRSFRACPAAVGDFVFIAYARIEKCPR
jgi:hypothetical protein